MQAQGEVWGFSKATEDELMEAAEANRVSPRFCVRAWRLPYEWRRAPNRGHSIFSVRYKSWNSGVERFGARFFEPLDVVPIPALPIGALFI